MYILFSVNYLIMRIILGSCNRYNNNSDLHKATAYINTYIFALYVVLKIIIMHLKNDEYEYYMNYVDVLDMFRDYFLYDIVNMTVFSPFRRNIPFYVHHMLYLISYFNFYDDLIDLRIHFSKILFCEITQFFLINCWYIHKFTNYRSLLKINGILLLLTFFVFRVINFVYHTILSFYILPNSMWYVSYLLIILSSLNIYWFNLLKKMFLAV